jgi:hypothetical protein
MSDVELSLTGVGKKTAFKQRNKCIAVVIFFPNKISIFLKRAC